MRERATANLVRKGVLTESNSEKHAAAATLHYAAALFDPTHSSTTYTLGGLGVSAKSSVVSRLRTLLTKRPDNKGTMATATEGPLAQAHQERIAAARNVVLCVLARYSDVVDEVTELWEDQQRSQAGERLGELTAELRGAPEVGKKGQGVNNSGQTNDVGSSLHWIARYFVR